MRYGLALLPAAEQMQKVVVFQNQHAFPAPILGMEANLPHITLIQSFFDESIVSKGNLDAIAGQLGSAITAPTQGLSYSEGGWWFINFEASAAFKTAQKTVFSILEPHIAFEEIDFEKDYSQYSELEQSNYFKYGYRYAGDAFHPHFTMGHDETTSSIPSDLIREFETEFAEMEFTFNRLAWYELGASGACASVIEEISLKSNAR